MEMDRYEPGVPSWVDQGSPDLDGARAFYAGLFGWDCPVGPAEAGGYTVATLRGRTVAGLGPQMNPEAPPAWLTYVNVDSVDDTVAKVTAAGGTALMPGMDVMDVGRMAVVADPAGAVFGLWQPGTHPGAGLVNEPGTLCWNELVTTDVPGAKAFYQAVFGWGAEDQGGESMVYTEWKLGDRSVGGCMAKPADMPDFIPPHWGVYFGTEDTDATVARATELGASVMVPPTDIEPGRFAVLAAPDGAVFNVIALKAPA
jgi:predicted enzyme related to lactoylglutathione lyase